MILVLNKIDVSHRHYVDQNEPDIKLIYRIVPFITFKKGRLYL